MRQSTGCRRFTKPIVFPSIHVRNDVHVLYSRLYYIISELLYVYG